MDRDCYLNALSKEGFNCGNNVLWAFIRMLSLQEHLNY